MEVRIEETWKKHLAEEFEKPYFADLADFVRNEYAKKQIFPPAKLIFNAFDSCPFEQVRVVILGQDPYHGIGQAHGLCFSVNDGVKIPPSLQNIYKEVSSDLGIETSPTGNLERWAKQGVFLINATLTVELPSVCAACGLCKNICPVNAIDGNKKEPNTIDAAKCIKCGACISACAFHAVKEG